MECRKITLIFIFCLVAVAGALGAPANDNEEFETKCLNESVVVAFKGKSPFNIRMYTLHSDHLSDKDLDCSRTFTPHEPPVKEFNYKKCSYGSQKMKVYVDKLYWGIIPYTLVVDIDCTISVGEVLGSLVGTYFNVLSSH